MTKTEFAGKMLRIEAFIMEARSHAILGNDNLALAALHCAKTEITRIYDNSVTPDETKLFLAD